MRIVDIALSQVGIEEQRLNEIQYNHWYYGRTVYGGSYPYCAVFVAWCANQAELPTTIIPKTASVASFHRFFLDNNRFHPIDSDYIPNPGDIMIQRSRTASHTAIVVDADVSGFNVVEGNAGEGVVYNHYLYSDANLTGFGSPNYPEEVIVKPKKKSAKIMSTETAAVEEISGTATPQHTSPQMTEEELWDWFRYKGYSAEATAGIMGWIKCKSNFDPAYSPIMDGGGFEVGGMGLFRWTWEKGNQISSIPPTPDLNEGRVAYPNAKLTTYLNWCDARGFQYEDCISQLTYLEEVDITYYSTLLPSNMNSLSVEEAAKRWASTYDKYGNLGDQAAQAAQALYEDYSIRPAATTEPSSTGELQGTLANANMRTANVSIPVGVGRYTYIQYTVKSGDTLESIADEYNITPQMIMFANNLKEWKVNAGETIYIPQAAGILSKTEAQTNVGELETLTHQRSVTVSHPTAEVHFFGEYGKLAAKSTLNPDKNENVYNDIISISTSRNMSQDCPNFVVTLVWRNEWYEKLASNDMLIIYLQRPPETNHVVLYGLIDDIRKTMDWSSTQPKRAVQISGRGFNKALCHFDIGLLENYSALSEFTGGFFNQLVNIRGVSSAAAIEMVLNAYVDKGMKYKFGNEKTIKDYLVYQQTPRDGEKLMEYEAFTSFNGSMWNFIKELGNAPFNETYWEVIDDKPTLVHRPTPFNKDPWTTLNRITIKDDELVSNTTGRSDLETYTVFNCHCSLLGEETINLFPPAWYPPFYPKYGLRELRVSTVYELHESGYGTREFTQDLFNFNIKNNIFENGTLVVKGSNRYRIGERVLLDSEGTEFYVESVSHSFNVYNNWTTSLGVTRGLHPSQRFTPPFGAAEDLTPTIMAAIIEMTGDVTIDWYNLQERQFSTDNGTTNNGTAVAGAYTGANAGLYNFQGMTFTWPIQGRSYDKDAITSPFGPRNTGIEGASTYHKGIDIAYSYEGGEAIVAAADGTIIFAGAASGYGNYIEIDHGNGITTGYAHMYDRDLLVQVNQKVAAGAHIANVGANGIGSGPHLHFEVLINGEHVDPETAFQQQINSPFSDIGVGASMTEVATSCYQFLTGQMGLNNCAACAVLGNIQQESGFNLMAENGIGAFGLCQWLDSRRTSLESWCRQNGLEVTTVAGQMGFFNYELQTNESTAHSVIVSLPEDRNYVYQGAVNFGRAFERYGAGEEGSRGSYAVHWWDYFVKA